MPRPRRSGQRPRPDACRAGSWFPDSRGSGGGGPAAASLVGEDSCAVRRDADAAPGRSGRASRAMGIHEHRSQPGLGQGDFTHAIRALVGGAAASRRWMRDANAVLSASLVGIGAGATDDGRHDVGRSPRAAGPGFPARVRAVGCGLRPLCRTHLSDAGMADLSGQADTLCEGALMTREPGSTISEKLGASAGMWSVLWILIHYFILRTAAADPTLPGAEYVRLLLDERMKWEWAT